MGHYEDINIAETQVKRVPFKIELSGSKLDAGMGTVKVTSMLRSNEKDITPAVLDEEGAVINEAIENDIYIPGSQKKHTIDISKILEVDADLFPAIALICDKIFDGTVV